MCIFFFSSRRRHTRCLSDWSSDVCSSDLVFSLIADPQNTSNLYVGSDIGVFVSIARGATWARDDNPFAPAVTETLVLDPSTGQSVLVSFTHVRGVSKTVLPGAGDPCQVFIPRDSASLPPFW